MSTVLLFSCISEDNLIAHFPFEILHGHNAKVWVLKDSNFENDKEFSKMMDYRKTITFHNDGSFREQELIDLGSEKGKKGKYKVYLDEYDELNIVLEYVDAPKRIFAIENLSNNKLELLSLSGGIKKWTFGGLKAPKI